jgi:hypothetical protein
MPRIFEMNGQSGTERPLRRDNSGDVVEIPAPTHPEFHESTREFQLIAKGGNSDLLTLKWV